MRSAFMMLSAVLVAGCRSGEVAKEAPKVELATYSPKPHSERKKVAVIDFEDKTAYGQGRLGRGAADVLTTYLVKCQQFRVMERQQIAKVLDEQKFQQSGAVDQATAVKVGKILGVDMLVYGAVTNFGIRTEATDVILYQQKEQVAESTVDVRMITVETSEILFAETGNGSARREVRGGLGLGGRMSYDETLAGDSLRASIVKMMDGLIQAAP